MEPASMEVTEASTTFHETFHKHLEASMEVVDASMQVVEAYMEVVEASVRTSTYFHEKSH